MDGALSLEAAMEGALSLDIVLDGTLSLDIVMDRTMSLDTVMGGALSLFMVINGALSLDTVMDGALPLFMVADGAITLEINMNGTLPSIFVMDGALSLRVIDGAIPSMFFMDGTLSLDIVMAGALSLRTVMDGALSLRTVKVGALSLRTVKVGALSFVVFMGRAFSILVVIDGVITLSCSSPPGRSSTIIFNNQLSLKTGNLVMHVREIPAIPFTVTSGETTFPGSSGMECWVPGCFAGGEVLKYHAFMKHIPGVFSESLDSSQRDVLAGREQALLMAATFLRVRHSTLEELRADLDVLCMLGSADNRLITDDQQQAMAAFAQHLSGSDVLDTTFRLHPFSEVAAMIHWRVLMLIAARMNERQRAH
ncbi:hypothetical protein ACOMHN_066571 [Nucella lapillus]